MAIALSTIGAVLLPVAGWTEVADETNVEDERDTLLGTTLVNLGPSIRFIPQGETEFIVVPKASVLAIRRR